MTLSEITLPGTHDTGTYNLTFDLQDKNFLEPWVVEIIEYLERIGIEEPLKVILRWAVTQKYNVYEMLWNGIRFLDIRVCFDEKHQVFRLHHTLMGSPLSDAFDDVQKYMNMIQTEIIVIQVGGFINMNDTRHKQVIDMIESKIGDYMLPHNPKGFVNTYGEMVKTGKTIIVSYGDDQQIIKKPKFWQESSIYGGWANKDNYMDMENYVAEDFIKNSGNPHVLYKLQWILTASMRRVVEGLVPLEPVTSLHDLSHLCNKHLNSFLVENNRYKPNIIMVDFFGETDNIQQAININKLQCNDDARYRWHSKTGEDCRAWAKNDMCYNKTVVYYCPLTCGMCNVKY
eukprot:TRINITY_DN6751_c0_g1_i1.p1 TRINITY_DN6751_c0_g1~~TRINITY_DN6751_c0_g1_i1.p1  ORF type:complete len:392 (+),score=64.95 TRINITY_DN6751_c0_g1_i1:150-1178(+)